MDPESCLKTGKQFLEVFPEALAFNISILDKQKLPFINKPQCSR
jgi:hypothetical protein